MKIQLKADLMLLSVAVCWGSSFYLTDLCLADMGPLTLNAVRFLIAFATMGLFTFNRSRKVGKTTLLYSVLVGMCLAGGYIANTYGIMYTSLSNAGFICGLPVVITPLLGFVFKRQIPEKKFAFAIFLCLAGVALMSLNGQFRLALGDLLCLACSFLYAVYLLITETAVAKEEVDAFQLGVYVLGVVGVITLVFALIFESPHLPTSALTWGAMLFLAIVCSGLAIIVQAVAQKYTAASRVGLILTLVPVFSAVVAYVFAHEVLLPRAYAGALMMLAALLIMETDFKAVFRKVKGRGQEEEEEEASA